MTVFDPSVFHQLKGFCDGRFICGALARAWFIYIYTSTEMYLYIYIYIYMYICVCFVFVYGSNRDEHCRDDVFVCVFHLAFSTRWDGCPRFLG